MKTVILRLTLLEKDVIFCPWQKYSTTWNRKDSTFLKAVGIEFHIKGPKNLTEFWPKQTVSTSGIEKSDCGLVCDLL